MRIALAGNPNSGKTTLYNALTGKTEKVGNWAGVTVATKESPLKTAFYNKEEAVTIVDLPGAYSMSPFTTEESITRDFIKNNNVDVIINIVDGTNLSRSLFFTTQLLEMGIPTVVALNKVDINNKKAIKIDVAELSKALKCPVVETVSTALSDNGISELIKEAMEITTKKQESPYKQDEIDADDKDAVENADKRRFDFVNGIVAKVESRAVAASQKTLSDKVDVILANKWLGIPIFAVVMYAIFAISQTYVGPYIADWLGGYIEMFGDWVSGLMVNADPFLQALVSSAILDGLGGIIGFLPLIMVMFFLIALLEDCGYMARVAVVMDRYFKKVGLSGKSIIPMVIGTACAIPGVMASRTIKNERERSTTAMLTPFMPCGAKIPVIALFAIVFFSDSAWVSTSMYFLGIAVIFFGALIIKKITGHKNVKSFFIIELPEYKAPSILRATTSMLSRGKAFIIKAGTIILLCNVAVTLMLSFDMGFNLVDESMQDTTILATIAAPIAFILAPLGFGTWQLAAAAVAGFVAKENVVATLSVVFAISNFINDDLEVIGGQSEIAVIMGLTQVAAFAYLVFNLFTPPCFAAIGAMNAEMTNKKWLLGGLGLQFAVGYVLAFLIYQVGTLITTGTLGDAFFTGLVIVAAIVATFVYLMVKSDKK